jgi:oligopeptide transport system substrate-binding protein
MKKLATILLHLAPMAALLLFAATVTPGCGESSKTGAGDPGEVVVRLYETGDPKSIDPHKAGDVVSSEQCGMVYECLFQYDYLARPAKLVPCLAATEPEYDATTLTYTFTLRDDVYFSDDRCFHPEARGKTVDDENEKTRSDKARGRKLTAKDMEYSFKRLAALPDSGGFWVVEGKIVGLDAFREAALKLKDQGEGKEKDSDWRAYFDKPVAGLKVLDERRLQVKLTEVYPQFLYAITLSYGAAVAREASDYYGDQLTRHPVGTGPFILDHWWEQKELVWVANPRFRDERFPTSDDPANEMWRPLMGKKLPLASRVDFRIIKEAQPAYLEFLNGNLESVGMDKDQFTAAVTSQSTVTSELAAKGIRLRKYPEPTIHYISFNMNDPVVGTAGGEKARAIRRAMSHAINREDYIRRLLNNRGEVAGQLIPPGMKGNKPGYFMPSQVYDLEKARQALRDAGFKVERDGEDYVAKDPATNKQVTLNILHRSTRDDTKDYAVFLNNTGKRIGIKVESELMTFAEFLKRQDEGTGQAYDAGWVMDYPDSQNMLQLLYGPYKPPGINSASYASEEYDRLYKEMSLLDDNVPEQLERKLKLISRMHDVLDHDVPWVLMEYRKIYSLFQGWYKPARWDPPNAFAYTYTKYFYSARGQSDEPVVAERERPFWPAFILLSLIVIPAIMMTVKVVKNQS